jgi:hypothetical protein
MRYRLMLFMRVFKTKSHSAWLFVRLNPEQTNQQVVRFALVAPQ